VNGLLPLHRRMLLIRAFEEQVRRLAAGGATPGLVHLYAGQEAVAVGVCAALRQDDMIASHHRGHGHCLAKGMDPKPLMAEILGRRDGSGRGRGGSMHVFDPANGNLGTNGIVGGGVPLAAGAALAARRFGTDRVAVAFFGDGALNQGIVPEVMNMAAVWSLPVLFVCEHNGYGEFTASADVTAGRLVARGDVFGIPSAEVDGMDVLAVRDAALPAIARARAGDGPSFLVCHTWRYSGHHAGDRQDYKESEEDRRWRARDPIPRLAARLAAEGIDDATLDALAAAVSREVADAVAFARASPEPEPSEFAAHVFA
jgi:TPP-dependent pyruvate/acetoin dehydrogenase alpha subunit